MKLEEITNEIIFIIDWVREDRQRMLRKLSAAEASSRNSRHPRNRIKAARTIGVLLQSALIQISVRIRQAFAARRRRYLYLCAEIQQKGYVAAWHGVRSAVEDGDKKPIHEIEG